MKLNPFNLTTQIAPLPFHTPISFADFSYDSRLRRVLIPAGGAGKVALIDPTDLQVQLISGFSRPADPSKTSLGVSSIAAAGGVLYGLDPETLSIKTIRLGTGNIVGSTPVQALPDTIRFVSATHEVWVTEKGAHQIEIFSIAGDESPVPVPAAAIPVPNGPEGLLIDDQRGLAFTNRPNQSLTDVIQVMTHTVIAQWGSGCSSARGMAIDESEGYLFVACEEGKLVAIDIDADGTQITSQNYGGELDAVAYNPKLHHVYLPSGASGVVAIFQLHELPGPFEPTLAVRTSAPSGAAPASSFKTSLLLLGTADTGLHANCLTSDEYDTIWVCNPTQGNVFYIHDDFPDTGLTP